MPCLCSLSRLQVERYNRTIKALTYSAMKQYDLVADWPEALKRAAFYYNYRKLVCATSAVRCAHFRWL